MSKADAATLAAVAWCRKHNAFVRFESSGRVTVKMNGTARIRDTLVECVAALESFWSTGPHP